MLTTFKVPCGAPARAQCSPRVACRLPRNGGVVVAPISRVADGSGAEGSGQRGAERCTALSPRRGPGLGADIGAVSRFASRARAARPEHKVLINTAAPAFRATSTSQFAGGDGHRTWRHRRNLVTGSFAWVDLEFGITVDTGNYAANTSPTSARASGPMPASP